MIAFIAAYITTRTLANVVPISEQLYSTVSVSSPAMFSAIPQKNRAAATTYFDEHLSHNDYYTQGEVWPRSRRSLDWHRRRTVGIAAG